MHLFRLSPDPADSGGVADAVKKAQEANDALIKRLAVLEASNAAMRKDLSDIAGAVLGTATKTPEEVAKSQVKSIKDIIADYAIKK